MHEFKKINRMYITILRHLQKSSLNKMSDTAMESVVSVDTIINDTGSSINDV